MPQRGEGGLLEKEAFFKKLTYRGGLINKKGGGLLKKFGGGAY